MVTTGALAGGVSSPVRAGAAVGGAPFVQTAGRGAYAFDAEGRAYIDYVMAYGPLLFGHAHPALTRGLDEIAARGTVFGSTHPEEERLADRICAHLPTVELVRFFNTGTEAAMSAFRVARAFTRRTLVVRFAGNYHGHFDAALHGAGASAGSPESTASGIPGQAVADVAVARYNDPAGLDRALRGRGGDLAAIVLEPIVGNMGLVPATAQFLDAVFERAAAHRALVVFDEVITWLRLGLGGAQGILRRRPDLTDPRQGDGRRLSAGRPRRPRRRDARAGARGRGVRRRHVLRQPVLDRARTPHARPHRGGSGHLRAARRGGRPAGRGSPRCRRASRAGVSCDASRQHGRHPAPPRRPAARLRRRGKRRPARVRGVLPRDARAGRPARPVAERVAVPFDRTRRPRHSTVRSRRPTRRSAW